MFFEGTAGSGIAPGSNRKITWNAGVDLPAKLFSNVRVSVQASDDTVPAGTALIPAGSFMMGDTFNDSTDSWGERTVHTVNVSAFYMDRYEVTKALWDDVRAWGVNNSYTDLPAGGGKAANHPVHSVSWRDVVKWCNARSEKAGLVPAYYTSAAQTTVYRTGEVDMQNDWVKWNAGYRLPTEAEWEKAARGGSSGRQFPWGDTDNITHSRANYKSNSNDANDISSTRDFHPTFNDGDEPYTSPVGFFEANGYGLYDMAGNVWERCWDWWSSSYYNVSARTNPRGPASSGFNRVIVTVRNAIDSVSFSRQRRQNSSAKGNALETRPSPDESAL